MAQSPLARRRDDRPDPAGRGGRRPRPLLQAGRRAALRGARTPRLCALRTHGWGVASDINIDLFSKLRRYSCV